MNRKRAIGICFFAEVARRDGYMEMAENFKLTADNEQAHAKRFYNLLVEGGLNHEAITIGADFPVSLGDTHENLISAAQGEHEEWSALYKEGAETPKKKVLPMLQPSLEPLPR